SACVLKRNHHECLDQFLEVDLTSDRLRYFDDSGEVQVLDRRPNGAVGMQRCRLLPQVRVCVVQLTDLAVRSPKEVAIPGFEHIRVCELLETTCCVESRGELVGDRLIIDKAVVVRRADGLFVELLGLEHVAFDPGNLRAYQRGTVFKVLRAMLRPYLLLLLVSSERREMPLSRVVRCRVNGRSSRECTVKMILGIFQEGG